MVWVCVVLKSVLLENMLFSAFFLCDIISIPSFVPLEKLSKDFGDASVRSMGISAIYA